MAKPNYQFEKRQRDLAKKQKQEEKRRQKLAGKSVSDTEQDVTATAADTNVGCSVVANPSAEGDERPGSEPRSSIPPASAITS